MIKLDKTAQRRFMDSFDASDPDVCWKWMGTKNNAGYPLFSYHGRIISATKTAYQLYYKRNIPNAWVVAHTCNTRHCVNPDHLYITSRSDLMKALYQTGQLSPNKAKGTKNPNAKLTEDEVRSVRQRKADGATLDELAAEFGVSKTTISMIHNRKLWAHVV